MLPWFIFYTLGISNLFQENLTLILEAGNFDANGSIRLGLVPNLTVLHLGTPTSGFMSNSGLAAPGVIPLVIHGINIYHQLNFFLSLLSIFFIAAYSYFLLYLFSLYV